MITIPVITKIVIIIMRYTLSNGMLLFYPLWGVLRGAGKKKDADCVAERRMKWWRRTKVIGLWGRQAYATACGANCWIPSSPEVQKKKTAGEFQSNMENTRLFKLIIAFGNQFDGHLRLHPW